MQSIGVQMSPFGIGVFNATETVTANEPNPNPSSAQSTAAMNVIPATN